MTDDSSHHSLHSLHLFKHDYQDGLYVLKRPSMLCSMQLNRITVDRGILLDMHDAVTTSEAGNTLSPSVIASRGMNASKSDLTCDS
jgi:hypothetical protein